MLNESKSPTPLKSGDKTPKKNSPVSVNQDGVLEHRLSYTCYVPENFNINVLVIDNPPEFKFHRDKFNYIAHLINDIPSKKKNLEDGYRYWEKEDYSFTSLYSPLLQAKIQDYKKYIQYLTDNGVLVSDNLHIKGQKSIGYKFSKKYQTDIKPVPLTKQIFIKRVLQFVNVDYDSLKSSFIKSGENNEQKYDYLTKWFNEKLTIDYVGAKSYLDELFEQELLQFGHEKAMIKKNLRKIVVEKIHRGNFLSRVDMTVGRLHTVLTQLKSELRQFVRYDGKKLVAADLKNSQPYLSTILFDAERLNRREILKVIKSYNHNFNTSYNPFNIPYYVSKNIETYKNYVESGKLYERFVVALIEEGVLDPNEDFDTLRGTAKKAVLTSIFSPNNAIAYKTEMKIFKQIFPEVYSVFKTIKYGKGKHNTLAILLQKIETELVLDEVCKIISEANPSIPIFTLHDAVITTENHIEFVEMVMKEVLAEAIGLNPTIKREYWSA